MYEKDVNHLNVVANDLEQVLPPSLPARASEQGNVIGSVRIREYGSTLYVGLARAVSPTNTNFRLTFLLTRLQEALYEDLAI